MRRFRKLITVRHRSAFDDDKSETAPIRTKRPRDEGGEADSSERSRKARTVDQLRMVVFCPAHLTVEEEIFDEVLRSEESIEKIRNDAFQQLRRRLEQVRLFHWKCKLKLRRLSSASSPTMRPTTRRRLPWTGGFLPSGDDLQTKKQANFPDYLSSRTVQDRYGARNRL